MHQNPCPLLHFLVHTFGDLITFFSFIRYPITASSRHCFPDTSSVWNKNLSASVTCLISGLETSFFLPFFTLLIPIFCSSCALFSFIKINLGWNTKPQCKIKLSLLQTKIILAFLCPSLPWCKRALNPPRIDLNHSKGKLCYGSMNLTNDEEWDKPFSKFEMGMWSSNKVFHLY